MPSRLVAGVMSGTSADGVDVALVEAGPGWRWRLRSFSARAWSPRQRTAILAAAEGHADTAALAQLHFNLGRWYGAAVLAACAQDKVAADRLAMVACHGQTVYHAGGRASLQLGEPAVIAAMVGAPVVANFRAADIAAGGQGAPLVPWVDWLLLRHPRRYRVALNLGGIANVTLLPPACTPADVIAFDTGPGNLLLDSLVRRLSEGRQRCDRDGRRAARGKVLVAPLRTMLRDRYYRRPPPKSAGREQFGAAAVAALMAAAPRANSDDLLATAVALTACTVARGIACGGAAAQAADVIVSGGGVRNPALMQALRAAAPGCHFVPSDAIGIPAQAKEAIAFALLGEAHRRGLPANLPQVTGARRAVVLGTWTPAPGKG